LRLVTDPNPTPNAETIPTADPEPPTAAPHRPTGAVNQGPVLYKGEPLEPERGPGLGCFRFQLVALAILIVATPLSVGRVPDTVTAILLFVLLGLLLVSGQTIIFLLRLVAADRRGRREPLAARTPTVGQLEDHEATAQPTTEPTATEPELEDAEPPTAETPAAEPTPAEPPAAEDGGPHLA